MKESRLIPRLKMEALSLPEDMLQTLKTQRFRTVQDIMAVGVADAVLLCGMTGNGRRLIESALNSPPKALNLFSDRIPFREARTFEERIMFSSGDEFLLRPVTQLSLPLRGVRILQRLNMKTIADILAYGITNFRVFRNIGEFTCADIEKAILDLLEGESLGYQSSFPTLLDSLLPVDLQKSRVVKARFGFDSGKGASLREVGEGLGVSLFRTPKIINEEMRKMLLGKAGTALFLLMQRMDIVLMKNGCIAAFEDIFRYDFFRKSKRHRVLFLVNLLCGLFPRKYRIIEGHYMTCLSTAEVSKRTESMARAYRGFLQQLATSEAASREGYPVSPRYILHCLEKRHDAVAAAPRDSVREGREPAAPSPRDRKKTALRLQDKSSPG